MIGHATTLFRPQFNLADRVIRLSMHPLLAATRSRKSPNLPDNLHATSDDSVAVVTVPQKRIGP